MTEKRKLLLKKATQFLPASSHKADLDQLSDEWLERYVAVMEETHRELFSEEEVHAHGSVHSTR